MYAPFFENLRLAMKPDPAFWNPIYIYFFIKKTVTAITF